MYKNDKLKRLLLFCFFITIVVHMVVFVSTVKFPEVEKLARKRINKVRLVLQPKKQSKKLDNSKKKQIVNSEQQKPKVDPDAKFLGKTNQSFNRQTKAKKVDRFKTAAKGTKTGSKNKVSKTVQKPKSQKVSKAKPVKKDKKSLSLSDLSINHSKPRPVKKSRSLSALGLKSGTNRKPGLAQNNDFIEDVPLGDVTNLNTQEFKFYGFYHRIRQQLEQHWGNKLREKAKSFYARGGRLPANENKITSLTVEIDSRGNIVKVYVKGTSGISELDDAAIESFNSAGPFPNPPQGMLRDGRAFIEWGFVVST